MTIRIVAVAAVMLAAQSVHAQANDVNVVTVPFTGPRASIPRNQLVEALCPQVTCVSQTKVTARGRTDWKKVRANKVDLVIAAKVIGPAAKRMLQVEVYDGRAKQRFTDSYPLARNGKLSRSSLQKLTGSILELAESAAAAAAAEAPAEETPREEPPVEEERAEEGTLRELPERSEEPEAVAAEEPGEDGVRADRPFVLAELALNLIRRSLTYENLRVLNLRQYETRPVMFAPGLELELYPLARSMDGVLQGLGVETGFAYVLGLRSIDENDVAYPTTVSRFDLAARLNLWLLDEQQLMVAPILGYRVTRFVVGGAEDGTQLVGLPDISYGALRVGAEAQLAFGKVIPFVQLAYLHALSLGEIGSDAYFPNASASAFEAQLGAGYAVMPELEVRLGLQYTGYGLRFNPAEGAPYQAEGASDSYFGGALSARYSY